MHQNNFTVESFLTHLSFLKQEKELIKFLDLNGNHDLYNIAYRDIKKQYYVIGHERKQKPKEILNKFPIKFSKATNMAFSVSGEDFRANSPVYFFELDLPVCLIFLKIQDFEILEKHILGNKKLIQAEKKTIFNGFLSKPKEKKGEVDFQNADTYGIGS